MPSFRTIVFMFLLSSVFITGVPSLRRFVYRSKRFFRLSSSSGDESILSHLTSSSSTPKLDPYWIEQLRKITRPVARGLISQLVPTNELGYDYATEDKVGKRKSLPPLLDYVMKQKKIHHDKIVLTRCGDFYETYGVDAVMLVNYCGLNAMGNKAKAGCPVRNIQATLDCLTESGLSIAVIEEINDVDADRGPPAKNKLKTRALTQIVSPGAGTYIYDLCLRTEDIEFRDNRPVIGVLHSANGYEVSEIHLDERVVVIAERLTREAVRVLIESIGSAGKVYTQGAANEFIFLNGYPLETLTGYNSDTFHAQVLRRVGASMMIDVSDFRVMSRPSGNRPRPLYTSTAAQIGLIANANIPDLIPNLLPAGASAHSVRFLRRWLLSPPTHILADHFRAICQILAEQSIMLPAMHPVPIGKAVSLLSARQSNTALFRDIYGVLTSVLAMLSPDVSTKMTELLHHLAALTSAESGFSVQLGSLYERCTIVAQKIHNVILSAHESESDAYFVDPNQRIPKSFFERNEESFRGCVIRGIPDVIVEYIAMETAASALCDAVKEDFPEESDVMFDINNNLLMIKDSGGHSKFMTAIDRFGKPISRRLTTNRVSDAIRNYTQSCEQVTIAVKKALQALSDSLMNDIGTVIQVMHWAVIIEACASHTTAAKQKGWCLPTLTPRGSLVHDTDLDEMNLEGITPYWISRSESSKNTIRLRGIFLLTAPNMSGKSTLMRAVLVAALLANCGLFVPCDRAYFPRYDNFFLRTASYDVPSIGMSSFALEMDDLRVVLRDCTHQSLVMVDELGKGTSSRDGAAIAGALLEHLDKAKVSGIFATHLHEILELPLKLKGVQKKKMGMKISVSGAVTWTYLLEDGECLDSLALETARRYGLPSALISRAEELSTSFDLLCRPSRTVLRSNNDNQERKLFSEPDKIDKNIDAFVNTASKRYELEDVFFAFTNVGLTDVTPILVEAQYMPPVSMEGRSVLYVLHIYNRKYGSTFASTSPDSGIIDTFYVGETESLGQRLTQHRVSWKDCFIRAAAVSMDNKSESRRMETALIRELKRAGYELANVEVGGDGSHVLFSNSHKSSEDEVSKNISTLQSSIPMKKPRKKSDNKKAT